jgi:SAM-dependent methyltransferase
MLCTPPSNRNTNNAQGSTQIALNHEGLVQLGQYLKQSSYHHVAVTPLTHSYNNKRIGVDRAHSLRDIFGWSRPFARTTISPIEFDLMCNAGVLVPDGELWRSTIRWASLYDHICAHSAFPTLDDDAVFFGPDTYRFARLIKSYLRAHPGYSAQVKFAADIGCGSGAGAILIAEECPAAQISAVDINPKALQLTRVNAELSNTHQVSAIQSNLLDGVEEKLDLIVDNPPYMLDTQERVYRHGGGNLGEGLSQKIVKTALHRLAPGGRLLLYTGVAIVCGEDPLLGFVKRELTECRWAYEEIDPDVFSDELLKPAYAQVERIAAVALTLTKPD